MSELEIKANAMLSELAAHLRAATDRAAVLAGELAVARAENEALKKKLPSDHAPRSERSS
jgi:hypothetical protein